LAVAVFAVWLLVLAHRHEAPVPPPPAPPTTATAEPARPRPLAAPALAAGASDAREPSERERWVTTVVESGSGREPWTDQGTALLQTIARDAAHTETLGCYIAGCTATYTFASRAAYERAYDAAQRSADYAAWTGGKRWSMPEQAPDGEVTTALLLYRPD
jgi:hypothetical protein